MESCAKKSLDNQSTAKMYSILQKLDTIERSIHMTYRGNPTQHFDVPELQFILKHLDPIDGFLPTDEVSLIKKIKNIIRDKEVRTKENNESQSQQDQRIINELNEMLHFEKWTPNNQAIVDKIKSDHFVMGSSKHIKLLDHELRRSFEKLAEESEWLRHKYTSPG